MSLPIKLLLLTVVALPLLSGVTSGSEMENGDLPFLGNRRPGILEAPSDEPTGENAQLYRKIGALSPNEYLNLLSDEPDAARVKDLAHESEDETSDSMSE